MSMQQHFVRKRDLTKKHPEPTVGSLSTSSLSVEEHPTTSTSNFQSSMQTLQILEKRLQDVSLQQWQKSTSELFSFFLDSKRALLSSQQLTAFRASMALLAKYQMILKKQTVELNQQNASLTLGLFRRITDQVNKLTQDQKNDTVVQETQLHKAVFALLESFVSHLEGQASKIQRRPTLMRKNSLKKIEELPALRPSSRGKLSSLSKKDSGALSKQEMLGISKSKIDSQEKSSIEDIVINLCSIVKNLSANARLRRELLQEQYLRLINRYLCIWTDKNVTMIGSTILAQLSASYRHLAVQERSHKAFLESNSVQAWARLIEVFPTNQDIIFNVLRTLSKLSNYQSVCNKLNEKKACLKCLSSFFKFYKSNIHIIIRISIIFANLTSYLSDIRSQLYFDFAAWQDIYECFEYYAGRELSGKNQVEKMGLSMAAWDYQHIKKQSDIDCAIRIIRLIANIFTVPAIGQDIYVNYSSCYRELMKKLKILLQKKSNIQKSSQLIATILSCLSNLLFYDKQILMSNAEYKQVKIQLVHVLVDFVVQIDNEEICCESLRVVANMTRIKEFCNVVIQAKIHQALLILLESTSKEIVYYCLGVLSNLMADNNFRYALKIYRQMFKEPAISGIISILNDCDNDDFDLVTLALKTLASVVDARNQNIDPKLLAEIEECLMNLGSHCDKLISSVKGEATELQESRSLINLLLNSMPEQRFICPVKNCGRKFADEAKLTQHVKRRHKS